MKCFSVRGRRMEKRRNKEGGWIKRESELKGVSIS